MTKNPYLSNLTRDIPQTEQALPTQVKNNAGGFVFQVSDQTRLERFLILGTAGGTYYSGEQDLTKQNVQFIIDFICRDEVTVAQTVLVISENGRAYRNSPAIFVTALLFKHGKDRGIARRIMQRVCRTSTHLFEFASYIEALGGWGRSKRSAVANWYTSKTPENLSYQVVKYRQRNGWTHQDLMRLSHPVGVDKSVGNFVLGKSLAGNPVPEIIIGFSELQAASNINQIINVLEGFPNLPWEAIPTQFLKEPDVWRKLFYNGQLTGQALVRNITRLARIGAFDDMVFTADYAAKLVDTEMIQKTRLHPIQYLLASMVHTRGQINRNGYGSHIFNKDWSQNPVIIDALNSGFYSAFNYIEPANKRTMIGLDVSGSMGSMAMGLDLTCAELGAAMCMSIARTEPYYQLMAFANDFRQLSITPKMSFQEVLRITSGLNFGGTDCSLPMVYAGKNNIKVDTFLVFTDGETWAGRVHPYQALKDYRQKMGIDARLVVAAVTSTGFSIADPSDTGMLDICGADANMPRLVAEFSAGRI